VIWGISYLDFAILLGFLVLILAIGIYAARSVKHQADFYLSGRKMGKTLQFFLNFGNATDPSTAPIMAGQVYQKGVSGMWLQLQTLLFTPFFWFIQPWFRRARLTTMADLFIDRFNSKSVASAYAIFNIMVALITLAVGNLAGYKVVDAMLTKPESAWTATEAQSVKEYGELRTLAQQKNDALTPEQKTRMEELNQKKARGELHEHIGALTKAEFYIGYNLIIAIYVMLGGLKAAAITNAVQGLLILAMSVVLLPIGLVKVQGFSGLHEKINAASGQTTFWLAGTPFSDFTWYSIAAVTLGSMIQIFGLQHNMSAGGSAKDENTARFGMLVGGFTKRLVLICWMLCSLLAVAIFTGANKLAEPDLAWGALSSTILPIGLVGIMLAGMLMGHMPMVGLTSVAVSGLMVRNIYEPLFKGKSAKHYLRAGQVAIVLVLAASVGIAWPFTDLGSLWTIMITFNTFFGAVVFLIIFWRRLTAAAILVSFFFWIFIQGVASPVIGYSDLRFSQALTLQTNPSEKTFYLPATAADVAAGKAKVAGESIGKVSKIAPAPLFFDKVVPAKAPATGYEGTGHFIIENAILYYPMKAVGLDMANFSKAGLTCARWLFDSFFPFVCLIIFSLLTKPATPERAPVFYAKFKTPVAPTPELDQAEIDKNAADPTRWDHTKLFPGTQWEFTKWTRNDFLGFFGCWGIVGAILVFLWFILHVGTPWPWW
jgi:solute:Na+ symporter, SSS family